MGNKQKTALKPMQTQINVNSVSSSIDADININAPHINTHNLFHNLVNALP
jgi:hypothetical protein